MSVDSQHKVEASPRDGGVYIDIRDNFYDMEYADWALLSPGDALELRNQIDAALADLGLKTRGSSMRSKN